MKPTSSTREKDKLIKNIAERGRNMEYFVADSYKNFERIGEPFEKSGKMYTKARTQCDRCVKGVYVSRIENGQPVPHVAYGGVCLKCNGVGFITKEIRLYIQKEKDAADRSKQRAAERKVEERLAAASKKREEWLIRNGFTKAGITAVYVGINSFEMKDQLKEEGWKYSPAFGWRIADESALDKYGDANVALIHVDKMASFNLYGEGCWLSTAQNLVNQIRESKRPESKSQWIGEEKEKIINIPVKITRISGFCSRFGWTDVVSMVSGENQLTWFTSSNISSLEVGKEYLLSATVKEHGEYKGEKTTTVVRAKLKEKNI